MKNSYKLVNVSVPELVTVVLTAAFLAFLAGWFLRGDTMSSGIRVETGRTLDSGQEEPLVLPTPVPEGTGDAEERIDINTADAETLQRLPGIGQKRAEDIIAYREEHGPFRIVEQLTDVPGIGEGTLAGLIELITVSNGSGGIE